MPTDQQLLEQAESFKNQGNDHLKKNELDEAISSYEKAIELNPSNAIYFSNKAHVEIKLEQYGSAILDASQSIIIDPKYIKAYYRRAVAYSHLFRIKESKRDLNTILKIKPTDASSKKLLSDLIKLERKIAFEKAIQTEDEFDELFNYEKNLDTISKESSSIIQKNYAGPLLSFENFNKENGDFDIVGLNDDFIKQIIEIFKNGGKLPKSQLILILLKIQQILIKEPAFKEVTQSSDEKFTLVGDVHGQFFDLIHFFKENGSVSLNHSYLFNGDFVDRGSWSTEVIILLYLLKILYPNNLHLNRGNHETLDMNKMYGFEDECKHKYGEKIYKMFSKTFMELPLLTLLNNKVLIMHGGLFSEKDVTLQMIKDKITKKTNPKEGYEMELLWTDPQVQEGYSPSKRGIGVQFGPDITQNFLTLNKLSKIVRSHEVRMEGYSIEHNGGLITLFSAPNYCDSTGNKGALINVTNGDEFEFKQFEAQEHPPLKPMAYSNSSFM